MVVPIWEEGKRRWKPNRSVAVVRPGCYGCDRIDLDAFFASEPGHLSVNASEKGSPWPRHAEPTADAGKHSRPRRPANFESGPAPVNRRPGWPANSESVAKPSIS